MFTFIKMPNIIQNKPDFVKNVGDAIVVNTRMEVVHCSPAFAFRVKFMADEVVGKTLADFEPKTVPTYNDLFKRADFNNLHFEFFNIKGEYIHLVFNGYTLMEEEERYAIMYWNDITKYSVFERKYLSKEIELNTLIYKISHDLRGPVASSKGLLNLIKIENPDKHVTNYVDLIIQSIEKLDGRITDLAKVAELATTDQYYFSEIDIHTLIYNAISDVSKNYDVFDMVFDFKIQKDLKFKTYQFALVSVFTHLFIFSIENKSHSEKLLLNLDVHLDNQMLYINLKDNGMGIHESGLEKVFSPFFRVNETQSHSSLSLFTIKKSVEFLRGEVDLKSVIGKGTEFWIKIPVY